MYNFANGIKKAKKSQPHHNKSEGQGKSLVFHCPFNKGMFIFHWKSWGLLNDFYRGIMGKFMVS